MEKRITALVILNYNNYVDTINCIESVEKYNTAPIKYIIVDNGSTDKNAISVIHSFLGKEFKGDYLYLEEDNKIPDSLPKVTFLVSKTNDGYARGNNKGLNLAYRDATIDNILILNNDVLFIEDIIPELVDAYYHKLKDVAILSPILYKKDLKELDYNCAKKNETIWDATKKNLFHYYYLLTKQNEQQISPHRYLLLNGIPKQDFLRIELPSGSCMFINKKLFQEIGSFDSNTFLYWEENILFKKIERIHKVNYLCTKIKCIHLGASSTSLTPSLFIINCGIESKLYYMRYYSGCNKLSYWLFKMSCYLFKYSYILQKKVLR